MSQSQFAFITRAAVSDDIAGLYMLSHLDDGTLVDANILVRTAEFGEVIDIHIGFVVGSGGDGAGSLALGVLALGVPICAQACPSGSRLV